MSEQSYEISSPLPFLFSADLLEEYNDKISSYDEFEEYKDEISSDDEFEHEIFNETLNNDNTSDIYFKDSEENQESDYEIFEQDIVIDDLEHTKFTPCVVIDFINGKIQRCGESTKLRQLRNLFGT